MEKNKKDENLAELDLNMIDEEAFLLVSQKDTGVTDNPDDIAQYLLKCLKNGEGVTVLKGYKSELLSVQQRILLMDNAMQDIQSREIEMPEIQTEYNLTRRKIEKKSVIKILDKFSGM